MPVKPGRIIQVNGIQSVIRAYERLRDHAVPAVRQGLLDAGQNILLLAKYYCPKDTHALTNSGRVVVADNMGDKASQLRVHVTFGGKVGFESPMGLGYPKSLQKWRAISGFEPAHLQGQVVYYAVYVHENLAAYHEPPTQAKFLERAVRESWDSVAYAIGRRIEETVAAGGVRDFGRLKIPPPAVRPG